MSDPYRTSALPAVVRRRTAFGTVDHLLVRLPLPPDEVIAKLATTAQPEQPSRREQRTGHHRPFCGVVQSPEFRLVPLGWTGRYVRIDGSVRPDGDGSIVLIRVAFLFRTVLFTLITMALVVAVLVAFPRTPDVVAFYALRTLGFFVTVAAGSAVAIRLGLAQATQALLIALDPALASGDAVVARPSLASVLDFDSLSRRLDDWEKKQLK